MKQLQNSGLHGYFEEQLEQTKLIFLISLFSKSAKDFENKKLNVG